MVGWLVGGLCVLVDGVEMGYCWVGLEGGVSRKNGECIDWLVGKWDGWMRLVGGVYFWM